MSNAHRILCIVISFSEQMGFSKELKKIKREGKRIENQMKQVNDVFHPSRQERKFNAAVDAEIVKREEIAQSSAEKVILSSDSFTITIEKKLLENPYLLEEIGRGSFGVVRLYEDSVHGKIAIKQIVVPVIDMEDEFKCFQKEVDLLKQLNHRHVVRYIDSTSVGNNWYIFMEYMGGGTIKKLLLERQNNAPPVLDSETILRYSSNIIDGLAWIHDKNVIHRDLRAMNILLTESKEVAKIADFGLSQNLSSLSMKSGSSSEVGNPLWNPPEIIDISKWNRNYGCKVDVWSLGITILEMVFCIPPFMKMYDCYAQYKYVLVFDKIVPEIPAFLDDRIKLILERCLVYDYNDRCESKNLLEGI